MVRIPYWLGMLGGYGFDALAKLSGHKLPISSVRVQKFCATTQFAGEKLQETGFVPPFTLDEGLRRTLAAEFGNGNVRRPCSENLNPDPRLHESTRP